MERSEVDWQAFIRLRGKGLDLRPGLRPGIGVVLLLAAFILWATPRAWMIWGG